MHGGVKVYRGAASAARAYVEADRSRADDYYLSEGTGLARRFSAAPGARVEDLGTLDGNSYEQWVAGYDPVTGQARGRLRQDPNAVRFVEITVNGPKTWSLAAALNPEVAAAYDAAQDRAAAQVIGWVAEHATTRIGPRGRQVQVPVERIEAVTVRHYTSRAGDPHRHLHLQVNARVFAEGTWRGLHTVGVRDSIEALNGIGHAAMATDPEFRTALVSAGFTFDPNSGEISELAPYAANFSARAAQIGRNIDRYEAEWRQTNPGQEPGPVLRQAWDRRAWKQARPDKVVPTDGTELLERWNDELRRLGYQDPSPRLPLVTNTRPVPRPGELDREAAVEVVLSRLGARRSAWNAADIRGEVEKWIAATGLVADSAVRIELAEDLTARAVEDCTPLLGRTNVPGHIRSLSTDHVLGVEADIVTRLARRAGGGARRRPLLSETLDGAQKTAAETLVGTSDLVVVEGAAGSGKTTTLKDAAETIAAQGHRMMVVTPTRKAAQVAAREIGADATSVAWLLHQHRFRWDPDGRWTRVTPEIGSRPESRAVLRPGDLLVVDEAGMLDQDSALALLTVADEAGARIALVGDRHQLPAVGRGGVLDLAHRWANPDAVVALDTVHRFSDPEYAAITLAMRTGSQTYRSKPANDSHCERESEAPGEVSGERVGEVFGTLLARDQIRIYASEAERAHALANLAAAEHTAGRAEFLMIADTREQTAALNGVIRDLLTEAGRVDDHQAFTNQAGERIGVGDRVATRHNDRNLGVANRDTWTLTAISDVHLVLHGGRGEVRSIPAAYAVKHLELAYATTVYGAQGETTSTGHLVLGEHTSAASAYVAMTRGRDNNVAHVVATDIDDAHRQWEQTFSRDRADLGPTVAAHRAAEDVERYGPNRPERPAYPGARRVRRAPQPAPARHEEPPYTRPANPSQGIGR
ncbi:MAG: ATP-dependent exoDNAse [Marmoricola sp.]|nr:ATP-dependent exoDNAse [Marmoricola sp.]